MKEYQDEITHLNVPENTDSNVFQYYKDLIKKAHEDPTRRSAIIGPLGQTVWEEPEAEYKARMNKLFYEVK